MGSGPGTGSRAGGGGAGGLATAGQDLEQEMALAAQEEAQTLAEALEAARAAGETTLDERAWTADEVKSLDYYQGPGHEPLNGALRYEPEDISPQDLARIANLDAVINGSRITSDGTFWRGTLLEPFKEMTPGSIVQDAAFMSTTRSFDVAQWFAESAIDFGTPAILKINAKAGTRAADMNKALNLHGPAGGEQEFLFGRNVKLRFEKASKTVYEGRSYDVLHMTVID